MAAGAGTGRANTRPVMLMMLAGGGQRRSATPMRLMMLAATAGAVGAGRVQAPGH